MKAMKLLVHLSAVVCLVAAATEAQVITNFNFNSDTPGTSPQGWTSVSPSTPAAQNGASVTSGNAVNVYDYNTAANARLEQDFAAANNLHLSLSFTRNANITPTTSTQGLYISLGTNGLSQGTSANRAANIRLFNDGGYRIDVGTQTGGGAFSSAAVSGSNTFGEAGTTFNTHTLDIYAYGGTTGGATFSYTGPDSVARVLDPHSFAVYIDGILLQPSGSATTANGDYGFQSASFYGDPNLGRLGLVTGGSAAISGMDFLVDNIVLSTIPEPSTITLLCAGGLLLIGLMRRSRHSH
jgi:hypothetical protein